MRHFNAIRFALTLSLVLVTGRADAQPGDPAPLFPGEPAVSEPPVLVPPTIAEPAEDPLPRTAKKEEPATAKPEPLPARYRSESVQQREIAARILSREISKANQRRLRMQWNKWAKDDPHRPLMYRYRGWHLNWWWGGFSHAYPVWHSPGARAWVPIR